MRERAVIIQGAIQRVAFKFNENSPIVVCDIRQYTQEVFFLRCLYKNRSNLMLNRHLDYKKANSYVEEAVREGEEGGGGGGEGERA